MGLSLVHVCAKHGLINPPDAGSGRSVIAPFSGQESETGKLNDGPPSQCSLAKGLGLYPRNPQSL